MKSINNVLLLFSILILAGACKRYTCPTYTSSLMIGTTPIEKYQLYPSLDTTSEIMRDDPTLSAPPVYTMFVKSDTSEEWIPTASLYGDNYKAGKQSFWERLVFKLTPRSSYDKRMAEFELGRNKKANQGIVYNKKRVLENDEHMNARKVARVQWDRPTFHFEEEDTTVIFEEFADSTVSLADADAVERELMAIYNDTLDAVVPENEINDDSTAITEVDPNDPTILPANYPKYNIEQLMYESMFKAELEAWKAQGVNEESDNDSTETKFNLFGLFKKNGDDADLSSSANEEDTEGFSNFDSFDEGFSESEEDYFKNSIGDEEETEEENAFNIFKKNQAAEENPEAVEESQEEEVGTPSSSIE